MTGSMAQQRHSCTTLRLLPVTAAVFTVVLLYNTTFSRQEAPTNKIFFQSGNSSSRRGNSYVVAAAANISRFKQQLLAGMVPYFARQNTSLPGYGLEEEDWQLFKPIISCPSNRPLTKYAGEEDGSKFLCQVDRPGQLRRDCIIYSLGSNGDFKFEQEMLSRTSCKVHTLDCTYNGTSQGQRHAYHKWCLASAATAAQRGPPFYSWSQVTQKLGHNRVDILKIDVDGYEYEIVGDWGLEYAAAADGRENAASSLVLPHELAMEVHMMIKPKPSARPWLKTWLAKLPKDIPHTLPGMGLFFLSLAELGYGVYMMEINGGAPECCSEVSLLRVTGSP
ncbi:methyltransferase domain-containing protein [Scenedesmus sp. NREL 46B-D3]|nr:methyltransferase domain-containing protein [Scenedesmus sp. NREL 46B-D3]